jgi:hypothetical protein
VRALLPIPKILSWLIQGRKGRRKLFKLNSWRPRGFWQADMRYFLWRSVQVSSEQFSLTRRSSELAMYLLPILIAGRLPIFFSQFPLQTLALGTARHFRSCINSTSVSPSETRTLDSVCPAVRACLSSGPEWPAFSSAPQLGAPATESRDPGNQATSSRFRRSSCPFLSFQPHPSYSLFLSIPFIFPLVEIPFSI